MPAASSPPRLCRDAHFRRVWTQGLTERGPAAVGLVVGELVSGDATGCLALAIWPDFVLLPRSTEPVERTLGHPRGGQRTERKHSR